MGDEILVFHGQQLVVQRRQIERWRLRHGCGMIVRLAVYDILNSMEYEVELL